MIYKCIYEIDLPDSLKNDINKLHIIAFNKIIVNVFQKIRSFVRQWCVAILSFVQVSPPFREKSYYFNG